jgi:hypothetical protein
VISDVVENDRLGRDRYVLCDWKVDQFAFIEQDSHVRGYKEVCFIYDDVMGFQGIE